MHSIKSSKACPDLSAEDLRTHTIRTRDKAHSILSMSMEASILQNFHKCRCRLPFRIGQNQMARKHETDFNTKLTWWKWRQTFTNAGSLDFKMHWLKSSCGVWNWSIDHASVGIGVWNLSVFPDPGRGAPLMCIPAVTELGQEAAYVLPWIVKLGCPSLITCKQFSFRGIPQFTLGPLTIYHPKTHDWMSI